MRTAAPGSSRLGYALGVTFVAGPFLLIWIMGQLGGGLPDCAEGAEASRPGAKVTNCAVDDRYWADADGTLQRR